MIERFLELEDAVKSTLATIDRDLPKITSEEWTILKELCQILKPYESITKTISGEKYCTAALVTPMCQGLKNVHQKLSAQHFSDAVKHSLIRLFNGFENRLGNVGKSKTLQTVTFLDPRFKSMVFGNSADDVKKNTTNLLSQRIAEANRTAEVSANDQFSGDSDELSIWSDFDKTVATTQPQGSYTSIEVQRYLEDDILPRNKESLQWWNSHKIIYPNLAKLAQERLCILASSVPCERLFSKAGMVITDRRNRNKEKKANMILFLNSNHHYVEGEKK
ncbi:hypothetical protein J437_LFUL009387 [Ladona fulva]|uniref:HAT C-terminal dimerisation domain-containing protein n=1 Tax=Ladona fulva TaxID=123851 RepID=A0A8K0K5Z0_LADFU|nr:hypothetical protein J437_LFUL009387 [Ladona fulva]